MTKTKYIRLLTELIDKYGDVEIAQIYDYWKSRLIDSNDEYIKDEDCYVSIVKISTIKEHPEAFDIDYKKIVAIVTGKDRKPRYPIEIPESKALWESAEQAKLREKHQKKIDSLMNGIMRGVGACYPFCRMYEYVKPYYDIANLTNSKSTPKEFGMAMDNHKKRH